MKETEDRLNRLEHTIKTDAEMLETFETQKEQLHRDKQRINEEITIMQRKLNEIRNVYDSKTEIVNNVKRKLSQISKEIEKSSKENFNKVFLLLVHICVYIHMCV